MTDHIRINPTAPRISYVGNGVQAQFIFPFAIFKTTDLGVSLNGALQSGGFVISGAGQSNGGTVTFAVAPAASVVILLERTLILQRVSDFLEGGEFSANSLNNELDYMAGCLQQLAQDMVPMVRTDKSESSFTTTLPARTIRANRVLGFDGDGQFLAIDTTATYSAPSFYATGTGATTRTLLDKNREIASVKDYGAIGDGVTDDTNAFVNALTAKNAVFIPAGTYQISQSLEIGSNKLLCGAGKASIIKSSGTSFDPLSIIGSYNTLRDFTIDGGDSGIMLYGKAAVCQNNTIHNILIKNVNIGIELDGYASTTNTCRWNSFSDIVIERMNIDGVYLHTSGVGDAPMANKFNRIKVASSGVNSTGYGFNVTHAKSNNAFIDCEAYLATTALGGFRSGANADKNLVFNFFVQSTGTFAAVKLEIGSTDTWITNLQNATAGTDINDLSSGNYMTLNAGPRRKTACAARACLTSRRNCNAMHFKPSPPLAPAPSPSISANRFIW